MKLYYYDRGTKEYLGEAVADMDPLESEKQGEKVYLIPAHATSTPPPATAINEMTIFDDLSGHWSIVPDYRGEEYFTANGTMKKIETLGEALPADAIRIPPPSHYHTWNSANARWEADLAFIKKDKIRQLELQTTAYISKDDVQDKRMPSWRQSRWNEFCILHEKALAGIALNAREQMIYDAMPDTSAGETFASCYNNCLAAFGWIHQCISANNNMIVQIVALATVENVLAFDITACPYPAWIGV